MRQNQYLKRTAYFSLILFVLICGGCQTSKCTNCPIENIATGDMKPAQIYMLPFDESNIGDPLIKEVIHGLCKKYELSNISCVVPADNVVNSFYMNKNEKLASKKAFPYINWPEDHSTDKDLYVALIGAQNNSGRVTIDARLYKTLSGRSRVHLYGKRYTYLQDYKRNFNKVISFISNEFKVNIKEAQTTFLNEKNIHSVWAGSFNSDYHSDGIITIWVLYNDGTMIGKWNTQNNSTVIDLKGDYTLAGDDVSFQASGTSLIRSKIKTKVHILGNGEINQTQAEGVFQIDIEHPKFPSDKGTWKIGRI